MKHVQQQNESAERNYMPVTGQRSRAETVLKPDAATELPAYHRLAEQQAYRQMPVIEALQSESPLARREVMRALQGMTQTLSTVVDRKRNVDAMMAQLLQETRRMRARRRKRIAWRLAVALAVLALVIYTHGHILSYWWFYLYGGGAMAADDAASKRREIARALSKAGEPRAVGVLALVLRDGDRFVRDAADAALRQLLPRVQAGDATFIDAEQMAALLALAEQGDERMQIAILKALEQIGDERALPIVEQLRIFGTPQVQRQAADTLPFLMERMRRVQEQATLLRGAAAPPATTGSDHLLRPASPTLETTPSEQLLRST